MTTPVTTRPFSCDTFVVQRDATAGGALMFGKNSDRPAGEAQPLRVVPARTAGEPLRLAYVTVPDEDAFAHLGSAPFWCWGYEFGINEHGVVIGNEAQFSRAWAENVEAARRGDDPAGGIIGMELVRLGLERGATAHEAITAMTGLLHEYGQWGSGVYGKAPVDGAYDNSYLVADRDDAWVLETSGREWVARQIAAGSHSISNEFTIRGDFDMSSETLIGVAAQHGWIDRADDFDFAFSHTDPMTPLQASHLRQRRSQQLLTLAREAGGVDLAAAKHVLRDHFEGSFLGGPYFNAARPDFLTLCMHEHPSEFTWGNTAASMLVEHGENADDLTILWYTPLCPCVGVYIPIFLSSARQGSADGAVLSLPAPLQEPRAGVVSPPETVGRPRFDPASYWWRFQNVLDLAKGDASGTCFGERQTWLRQRFDPLERTWAAEAQELRREWRRGGAADRAAIESNLRALTDRAFEHAVAETDAFFATFGPEAATQAVDSRWRGEGVLVGS